MAIPTEINHSLFMRQALTQAGLAFEQGNLPIGAVVVHDGKVVATGHNTVDSTPDDTKHAELVAIQSIAGFLFAHKRECTIYTTLEPCMMCLGAIVNVGIDRIVFAVSDHWVGATGVLAHAEYYRSKNISIVHGVMAQEAQELLNAYVQKTGVRRHLSTKP